MDEAEGGGVKWMPVGIFRAVLACGVAEATLDHAVLERVEGEDRQAAIRCEERESGVEGTLELSELIVDGHAYGLEGSRRRMGTALSIA